MTQRRLTEQRWVEDAACAQTDPELFYPIRDSKRSEKRHTKAICAACPVKVECLQDALNRNEEWGIWGGLDERERRLLQRQEQVA